MAGRHNIKKEFPYLAAVQASIFNIGHNITFTSNVEAVGVGLVLSTSLLIEDLSDGLNLLGCGL